MIHKHCFKCNFCLIQGANDIFEICSKCGGELNEGMSNNNGEIIEVQNPERYYFELLEVEK